MNSDKINGFGAIFRFITPALIIVTGTTIMFTLGNLNKKVDKLDSHFLNHLSHHNLLEKEYEHRITKLEIRRTK